MRAQVVDEELTRLLAETHFPNGWFTWLWAKLQIIVGLWAVGAGVLFAVFLYLAASRTKDAIELWMWSGPPILFACGGYLALAGHRYHLYQSHNRLAAYLATVIRDSGNRHEHSG